jgi:hypothetical protein
MKGGAVRANRQPLDATGRSGGSRRSWLADRTSVGVAFDRTTAGDWSGVEMCISAL